MILRNGLTSPDLVSPSYGLVQLALVQTVSSCSSSSNRPQEQSEAVERSAAIERFERFEQLLPLLFTHQFFEHLRRRIGIQKPRHPILSSFFPPGRRRDFVFGNIDSHRIRWLGDFDIHRFLPDGLPVARQKPVAENAGGSRIRRAIDSRLAA